MSIRDISKLQRAIFLRFMKDHKEFALNEKTRLGKAALNENKKLWQIVSSILNYEKNGVKNTPESWEKIWKEWKVDVKNKKRIDKRNLTFTGGGSPIEVDFEYLDEELIKLLEKSDEELKLPPSENWEVKIFQSFTSNSNVPSASRSKPTKKPVLSRNSKAKSNTEDANSSESGSDDLIIIEEPKPTEIKATLPNANPKRTQATTRPQFRGLLKRKVPLNEQLSIYQKAKLKIMNDELKIRQEMLRKVTETNEKQIEKLDTICSLLAELKENV